jgi:hypothetical protein
MAEQLIFGKPPGQAPGAGDARRGYQSLPDHLNLDQWEFYVLTTRCRASLPQPNFSALNSRQSNLCYYDERLGNKIGGPIHFD